MHVTPNIAVPGVLSLKHHPATDLEAQRHCDRRSTHSSKPKNKPQSVVTPYFASPRQATASLMPINIQQHSSTISPCRAVASAHRGAQARASAGDPGQSWRCFVSTPETLTRSCDESRSRTIVPLPDAAKLAQLSPFPYPGGTRFAFRLHFVFVNLLSFLFVVHFNSSIHLFAILVQGAPRHVDNFLAVAFPSSSWSEYRSFAPFIPASACLFSSLETPIDRRPACTITDQIPTE